MAKSNPKLESALWLASLGFSIMPDKPKKKEPLLKSWKPRQEKCASENMIRKWWKDEPKANVGIVTGKISGIFVIDLDGPGARPMLEKKLGHKLPKTPFVKTGRGEHLYFKDDDNITGNRTKVLSDENGNSVDVRADGGQVLAPPSVHPNGSLYKWGIKPKDDRSNIAMCPPKLIELLTSDAEQECEATGQITKGSRNDAVTKEGGRRLDSCNSENELYKELGEFNRNKCNPPLPQKEIKSIAKSVWRYKKDKKSGESKKDRLVGIVRKNYQLFHDAEKEPFASIDGETFRVESKQFQRRLASDYYKKYHDAPTKNDLSDASLTITAIAVNDAPQEEVHIRIAGDLEKDIIYIDMADDKGHVIEITSSGWKVIQNPGIRFLRPTGMTPMPCPSKKGDIEILKSFVHLEDESEFALIIMFLLNCFRPVGPYIILQIIGGHGSAKSTFTQFLKSIIDPSTVSKRNLPRKPWDIAIAAKNSFMLPYDNLNGMSQDVSDALCGLSTGEGFCTRMLYTNDEEVLIFAECPVILNGITEIGTKEDLKDRIVRITFRPILEEERRPHSEIQKEFKEVAPIILGGLLDAASGALKNFRKVNLPRKPRMADSLIWAMASEGTLGWDEGTFARVYFQNQAEKWGYTVDSSPVLRTLKEYLVENESWSGTTSDLLDTLNSMNRYKNDPTWPKEARGLTAILNMGEIALINEGILISKKRIRGQRILVIKYQGDGQGDGGDGQGDG